LIHILHGNDEFSIGRVLSSMKSAICDEQLRDVNVTTFSAPGFNFQEVISAVQTVPFLSAKRMVVLDGLLGMFEPNRGSRKSPKVGKGKLEEWEGFVDQINNVPSGNEIVFIDKRLTLSNKLFVAIKDIATVNLFQIPSGRELLDWVYNRASEYELNMNRKVTGILVDSIGPNLRIIDSELNKLSIMFEGVEIGDNDVRNVVASVRETNIFSAVDAVIEGRAGLAITATRKLIESGTTISNLVALIARQIRLLLLAKDHKMQGLPAGQLGKVLKLSGYPLTKTIQQEASFTHERLLQIHEELVELDVQLKSTPVDDQVALEIAVTKMALTSYNGR